MTRRAWRVGLLLALLAVPALAGCAAEPVQQPALDDTGWVLAEWGKTGALRPALDSRNVTLSFSRDTQASGNAGCNGWGGSCRLSRKGTISFSEIIHTEMYCVEPGVMEQEQFFLDALLAAERYEVVDGKLQITGGGMMLVLSRA